MSQEAKPAVQRRSRATRDKLITALEEILREKHFDQITVAEIAEKAGVAVGTVYRRFKNKEAFIPVMLEQHRIRQAELAKNPEECLDLDVDYSLQEALKKLALYTWKQISKEAHILRTLYLHVRSNPEIASEDWIKLEEYALDEVRTFLDYYKEEIKRSDLEKAAQMTFYFFNSILIEKGLFSEVSPEWINQMDGKEIASEMADFAYGYLITKDKNID